MNKSLLASAITLSLGNVASVQAVTISITQMDWDVPYAATGTLNDSATGVFHTVDPFFFSPFTATQKAWYDTHSSTLAWSGGTGTGAISPFTYTFHLIGNQVAAGFFFDWHASIGIPVLTIFDCPVKGGGACSGHSLTMTTVPFPGQQPGFNGVTSDDFPVSGSVVPVPATAWLFGSGLLGLAGIARRKKA